MSEKKINVRMWKKKREDDEETKYKGIVRRTAREREKHILHNVKRERKRAEKVYARAHYDYRDKKMGRRAKKESPKGRSSQRSLCGCLWLAAFMFRAPLACPLLFVAPLRVPRTKPT